MILILFLLVVVTGYMVCAEMWYERDFPRSTWKGFVLAILLLMADASAFGQASYYTNNVQTINSSAPQPGGLYPVLAIPNTAVVLCQYPANAVPCTNVATTYTDPTEARSCPSSAQFVRPGSTTCVPNADAQGSFGAWMASGNYSYTITTTYGNYGPYNFSVGGGGSGGSANAIITFANQTSVTMPYSSYGFITEGIITACYDTSGNKIVPGSVAVTQIATTEYNVSFAFSQPQSGYCTANSSSGGGGQGNPGLICNGVSDTVAIQSAITAAAVSGGTVQFPGNTCVTNSVTFPSNVTAAFINGSLLSINSGQTVTFNGGVNAPPTSRIFSGSGTVAGLKSDYADWFGSTVLVAINSLASTGGTVYLNNETYAGGMNAVAATIPNVTISGAGMAQYNSATAPTAFISGSGSIVQGGIVFNGQSGLVVHDLSIDVGDTYNNCTVSGLFNTPSSVSVSPTTGVNFYNVSVLGCSYAHAPSSLQHDVLVENSTGVVENNIITRDGYFGNVLKATNSKLSKLDGAYHWGNCDIVKSDDLEGVSNHDQYTDVKCDSSYPFSLQTFGGTLSFISIKGLDVTNSTMEAVTVRDYQDNVSLAYGTTHDVQFDDTTINTTGSDGLSFDTSPTTGNTSYNITVNNLNAANVALSCVEIGDGVTNGSQIENVTCTNATVAGVYSFDPTTSASHIKCFNVTGPCVTASTTGIIQGYDIVSTTSALTGEVTGGQVVSPATTLSSTGTGTFTCTSGGTITISNTHGSAASTIAFGLHTAGGTISTPPAMKTVTPGTGFSVLCAVSDTSTYNYSILNQ